MTRFLLQQAALFISLIGLIQNGTGQVQLPAFQSAPIELRFTKNLPGIQVDSIHTVGDELVYSLRGQVFEAATVGQIPARSNPDGSIASQQTPWHTLAELMDAYQRQDAQKVVDLYNRASREQVRGVIMGPNGQKILESLSQFVPVKVCMGFDYQKGYLAIVETKTAGIQMNYFVREKGKYFLSTLHDTGPVSWNLGLYWKFRPQPLVPAEVIQMPDSLSLREEGEIFFQLNTPGNWVVFGHNPAGQPVTRFIQDNGEYDLDSEPAQVRLSVKGAEFSKPGIVSFRVVESNYPIRTINAEIEREGGTFDLKVIP